MLPKIDNCPWIAAMLTDNNMDHFLDCVKQFYKINVNEKNFNALLHLLQTSINSSSLSILFLTIGGIS